MNDDRKLGRGTQAIHAGYRRDEHGALAAPIYQTALFTFPDVESGSKRFVPGDGKHGYTYSRWGNPTIKQLEDRIAILEGGAGAFACASGAAAINTAFFSLLSAGAHVVMSRSLYAPTHLTIRKFWSRFGVSVSFVDSPNLDEVRAGFRPETAMLYIETPSNPAQKVTDIAACATIAHEHNVPLVVDNTTLSPILQRPLALGADIVVHSATKAINGHSDVIGGMIVFAEEERMEQMRDQWRTLGATMDPHQAWLILRGTKTMKLRVLAAQQNAQQVAEFLKSHPAVTRVNYCGLPDHPGHALQMSQADGAGSTLSFELAGGMEAGKRMLNRVRLCSISVSFGGVETLIQHSASMTHHSMPREQRLEADISDGLVRLSVGCEDVEDIIADIAQALED